MNDSFLQTNVLTRVNRDEYVSIDEIWENIEKDGPQNVDASETTA